MRISSCGLVLFGINRGFQRDFVNVGQAGGGKMEEFVGTNTVVCFYKSVNDNFKWAFVGVYGPNDDNDRKWLWDELVELISWWEMPWCIGGDFNA
jgi:hypothetical protein